MDENNDIVYLKKQLKKLNQENVDLRTELNKSGIEIKKETYFTKILKFIKLCFKKKESIIKDFKKYFSQRYKTAIEQFEMGFINEDDINIFIKNEGTVAFTLQIILKKLDNEKQKKVYEAIINKDKPLLFELQEKAQNELIILEDRLKKINSMEFYEPTSIKNKEKGIMRIEFRIKKTHEILNNLNSIHNEELKKEKRPVGRPKKNKDGTIQESNAIIEENNATLED